MILEWLTKIVGLTGVDGTKLLRLLDHIIATSPEFASVAQKWKDALTAARSSTAIAALAGILKDEVADIAQGRLNPRNHPSDLI